MSSHCIHSSASLSSARACSLAVLFLSSLVTIANAQSIGPNNEGTTNSGSNVEKCSKSLGTIAVSEPRADSVNLTGYGLSSPAGLLRLMIQQSGCFDVAERGQGFSAIQQERALASGGELQQSSNLGKGQLQAADFVMTPYVTVKSHDSGGVGGAIFGRLGVVGALLGSMKFREAATSLLVSDVRSGLQVAAAEGVGNKTDFGIGGWAFGGSGAAALGGYTSTPEGKVIAASLLDNYNKIVITVRDKDQLIRQSSAASQTNAGNSLRAGAPTNAGELLCPRIANVRAFASPAPTARVLATLQKTDELIANGEAKETFVQVDSGSLNGAWVQRHLLGRCPGAR